MLLNQRGALQLSEKFGGGYVTTVEKFFEDLSVLHYTIKKNGSDIRTRELIERLISEYNRVNRRERQKPQWLKRARAIKRMREYLGLSQDQVARLMGVSQKSVSYAEGNNWRCSDELQEKVLETLLSYQQKISQRCSDVELSI